METKTGYVGTLTPVFDVDDPKLVTWTFIVSDAEIDHLAAGQELKQTYRIQISDGNNGGSVGQEVTITIVGTNDRPEIKGPDDFGFTEVAGSGKQSLVLDGQIAVKDVDHTDQVKITAQYNNDFSWRKGDALVEVPAEAKDDLDALAAALKGGFQTGLLGTVDPDNNDNRASIPWKFEVSDVDLNFLGVGETLTFSFTIAANDNRGQSNSTASDTVTITITGTNDAPVIDAVNGAQILEAEGPGISQALKTEGTLTFSDIDATDTVTLTTSNQPINFLWTGANNENRDESVLDDLIQQLTTGSRFVLDNINSDGTATWHYSAEDVNLDALGKGETLTFDYTIIATDQNGGCSSDKVTVTIRGTNDAPEIVSAQDSGSVTELADRSKNENKVVHKTSGEIIFSDVDITDVHTATVVAAPTADAVPYLGTFITSTDDVSNKVTWTFSVPDSELDTLGKDETRTQTYVVSILDGKGGTDTQDVTVTITGANDAPEMKSITGKGVKELGDASVQDISLDGQVSFRDVDSNDTVTLSSAYKANSFVWSGAADAPSADLSGLITQLTEEGNFHVGYSGNPADGGTYTKTSWAYQAHDVDLDFLAKDETITFKYTVTAKDQHGAATTKDVTITITGTNDKPVIEGDTDLEGTVREHGHDAAGKELGNSVVTGDLVASDLDKNDTLTWSWPTGDGTLVLNGTYGSIELIKDAATGEWSWKYTLDDTRAETRKLTNDDSVTETFRVRVTDKPGEYVDETITINIQGTNDKPIARPDVERFDELDPGLSFTGNVVDNDDNSGEGALTVIGFTVDGLKDGDSPITFVPSPTGTTATIEGVGSFTLMDTGAYTFTPLDHYSGPVPVITYTVKEPPSDDGEAGLIDTSTLTLIINPVADKPVVTLDTAKVCTREDTAIALGLNAPGVVDNVDRNRDEAGDHAERLGPISVRGIPPGAALLVTDGEGNVHRIDSSGEPIAIYLTDGALHNALHLEGIASAQGIVGMTKEQFESLQILPPPESGKNFTVTMSVTSYEVNDDGTPIRGIPGATSTASVYVDVLAVTDRVALELVDRDNDGDATVHAVLEDTVFNLKDMLSVSFPTMDAVSGATVDNGRADVDGSETHRFVIEGLPEGTMVAGQRVGADGKVIIQAHGLSTSASGLPDMNVRLPEHFSGKVTATITLIAQDTDKDSTGAISPEQDGVHLELFVKPKAGDVEINDTEEPVSEDGKVNFLNGIRVTDVNGSAADTGSEVITRVEFRVPAEWSVVPSALAGWTCVDEGGKYVIKFDTGLTQAQREAILDDFQIQPPAHSSVDQTIDVTVHTLDTNPDTGTHEATTTFNIKVEVSPVAERVGVDTDGDGQADLTINPNHAYATPAMEDSWFALTRSGDNAFKLSEGWHNADGDEQTFALLKPTDATGASLIGSQFTYTDSSGTHTVTFRGEPIEIPMEALDTVQFKPPLNMSGDVAIKVQAKTVDTDPETNDTVTATSGEATLTIKVAPQADQVSLGISAVTDFEDGRNKYADWSGVNLTGAIRPSSSDKDESFNIRISKVPEGSTLYYDEKVIEPVDGVFVIESFDPSKPLFLKPTEHTSGRYELQVEAQSVDVAKGIGEDRADLVHRSEQWTKQTLPVHIKGQADKVDVAKTDATFDEDLGGSGQVIIQLSDMVDSVRLQDSSETLTLKLTGLPADFKVQGGTFIGGADEGTGRAWIFTESDLENVRIIVPKHYSGDVVAKLVPVTTEADGHSWTARTDDGVIPLEARIKPVVDSTIQLSSSIKEDTYSDVRFAHYQNGDDNERLDAVLIKAGSLGEDKPTLYLVEGATRVALADVPETKIAREIIDGETYYVLTPEQYNSIQALAAANAAGAAASASFEARYRVTDFTNDKDSHKAVTKTSDAQAYQLTVTPVTDEVSLSLDAFSGDGVISQYLKDEAGNDTALKGIKLTKVGDFQVSLDLSQRDDEVADRPDVDGSEQFTQVLVEGVPTGVLVTGLRIPGTEVPLGAENVVFLGDGRWAITIPKDTYPPFTGDGGIRTEVMFHAGKYLPVGGVVSSGEDDEAPAIAEVSIRVVTQDTGAAPLMSDAIKFELTTDWADGDGEPGEGDGSGNPVDDSILTVDVDWERNPDFNPIEDTEFTLADALKVNVGFSYVDANGKPIESVALPDEGEDIPVDAATADLTATFTIRLTGVAFALPEDVDLKVVHIGSGADNKPLSVSVITVTGTQADLIALLDKIKVKPDANMNVNHGKQAFDVEITGYVGSGHQDRHENRHEEELVPVSDKASVDVAFSALGSEGEWLGKGPEEGANIGIRISVENAPDSRDDGTGVEIRDNALYFTLSMAEALKGEVKLAPEFAGYELKQVEGAPGSYKITLPESYTLGAPIDLQFILAEESLFVAESLSVEARVETREIGADKNVWVEGSGNGRVTMNVVNNEIDLVKLEQGGLEPADPEDEDSKAVLKGKENQNDDLATDLIQLHLGEGAKDVNEKIGVALLKGIPNDFLVYVKVAPREFKLANNAGETDGVNTWSLPLMGGKLPYSVAIMPPRNWSGTLDGLELYVSSGEAGGGDARITKLDFILEVTPAADGIQLINPAPAFGEEGEFIQLNLNIAMKDAADTADVTVRDGEKIQDSSAESVSLKLIGLGPLASFYVTAGSERLEQNVSYDTATDTYTIVGLTQSQAAQLGFVQAAGVGGFNGKVTVHAQTVEALSGTASEWSAGHVFDVTINRQDSTSADDRLLYSGSTLDGGEGDDTLWLRSGDQGIDFSKGIINIRSVENIDLLGDGHTHSLTGLGIDDVVAMVGASGTLTIDADDDSIHFEMPGQDGSSGWYLDTELTAQKSDGYNYYSYLVEYVKTEVTVSDDPEQPEVEGTGGEEVTPPEPVFVLSPVVHDAKVRVLKNDTGEDVVEQDSLLAEPPSEQQVPPSEEEVPPSEDEVPPSEEGAPPSEEEPPAESQEAHAFGEEDDALQFSPDAAEESLLLDEIFPEDAADDLALEQALEALNHVGADDDADPTSGVLEGAVNANPDGDDKLDGELGQGSSEATTASGENRAASASGANGADQADAEPSSATTSRLTQSESDKTVADDKGSKKSASGTSYSDNVDVVALDGLSELNAAISNLTNVSSTPD